MTLHERFQNGSVVTARAQAGRRRRAIAIALTVSSVVGMTRFAEAAPPVFQDASPVHGSVYSAEEMDAYTDESGAPLQIAGHAHSHGRVIHGHAIHGHHGAVHAHHGAAPQYGPLWAGYGAASGGHGACRSCGCAAGAKKRPSMIHRALGSMKTMKSRIDGMIFGGLAHGGCGCGCDAGGAEMPCDAIGADQLMPMPIPQHPAADGVYLSPMPHSPRLAPRTPVAVPAPRPRTAPPASDRLSDPFVDDRGDDQASVSSNPAVAQSGYYD